MKMDKKNQCQLLTECAVVIATCDERSLLVVVVAAATAIVAVAAMSEIS